MGYQSTTVYDSAGRQIQRIDPRGLRTSYVYDAAGRLVTKIYTGGAQRRVTQTWDSVSNRTLLWDESGRTTFTWGAVNRLNVVQNQFGTQISYLYDDAGQRTVLIATGGGRFSYTYDAAGQILEVVNPQLAPVIRQGDAIPASALCMRHILGEFMGMNSYGK